MYPVMTSYAQEQGYTVVLDASQEQNPVLYAVDSVNITKPVLEAYNQKSGVPAPRPRPSPKLRSRTRPRIRRLIRRPRTRFGLTGLEGVYIEKAPPRGLFDVDAAFLMGVWPQFSNPWAVSGLRL